MINPKEMRRQAPLAYNEMRIGRYLCKLGGLSFVSKKPGRRQCATCGLRTALVTSQDYGQCLICYLKTLGGYKEAMKELSRGTMNELLHPQTGYPPITFYDKGVA